MMNRKFWALSALGLVLVIATTCEAGIFRFRSANKKCCKPTPPPTPCVPACDNTNPDQNTNDRRNIAVKVNSLIACDTDNATKSVAGIKAGKKKIDSTLETFCSKAYRSVAQPATFELDREKNKPADILNQITQLPVSEKDVLFVYFICHGVMVNGEHRLFVGDPDKEASTDGIKRSDVISELKKKKCHAVVFITDACASAIESGIEKPLTSEYPKMDEILPRLLSSLPKGTFLDINTCSRANGEFAALNQYGPIATSSFYTSLIVSGNVNKWNDFQNIWAKNISKKYVSIRSQVLGSNSKYGKQENQTLDVKMDVMSGKPSPSSDIIN